MVVLFFAIFAKIVIALYTLVSDTLYTLFVGTFGAEYVSMKFLPLFFAT